MGKVHQIEYVDGEWWEFQGIFIISRSPTMGKKKKKFKPPPELFAGSTAFKGNSASGVHLSFLITQ